MRVARSNTERVLLALLVLFVLAIGAVLIARTRPSAPASVSAFSGPTFPTGVRAADFSLLDQDGHRVSLSSYRGRVVVLTFIHSKCHDTCPLMVEQIKGALNDLPGAGRAVPAIGITVAPAEDTRASRRAFLARYEMTGRLAFLSGPRRVVEQVWRSYAIQPLRGKVEHSTFVLLIDKRGIERVGFPAGELTPEGLSHDISKLEREPA